MEVGYSVVETAAETAARVASVGKEGTAMAVVLEAADRRAAAAVVREELEAVGRAVTWARVGRGVVPREEWEELTAAEVAFAPAQKEAAQEWVAGWVEKEG